MISIEKTRKGFFEGSVRLTQREKFIGSTLWMSVRAYQLSWLRNLIQASYGRPSFLLKSFEPAPLSSGWALILYPKRGEYLVRDYKIMNTVWNIDGFPNINDLAVPQFVVSKEISTWTWSDSDVLNSIDETIGSIEKNTVYPRKVWNKERWEADMRRWRSAEEGQTP